MLVKIFKETSRAGRCICLVRKNREARTGFTQSAPHNCTPSLGFASQNPRCCRPCGVIRFPNYASQKLAIATFVLHSLAWFCFAKSALLSPLRGNSLPKLCFPEACLRQLVVLHSLHCFFALQKMRAVSPLRGNLLRKLCFPEACLWQLVVLHSLHCFFALQKMRAVSPLRGNLLRKLCFPEACLWQLR